MPTFKKLHSNKIPGPPSVKISGKAAVNCLILKIFLFLNPIILNMKKKYLLGLLSATAVVIVAACSMDEFENDESLYQRVGPEVSVGAEPHQNLSEYNFFVGPMKNLSPARRVLPFKPVSELFTDYAHKKRFVWMPEGTSASYDGDGRVLNFPVGTILIKNFYYTTIQPGNTTKIIETRLLIKENEATTEASGWEVYNYIWNDEQTDAVLDSAGFGGIVPITFVENGEVKSANYRIPSTSQCRTCHKRIQDGFETIQPIGPKPQNLDFALNYGTKSLAVKNQLKKWQDVGYLDGSLPQIIHAMVNYKDATQPLDLRARSYLDINCAHCHRDGAHCDYIALRFNYDNPNPSLLGICMTPIESFGGNPFIVTAGSSEQSEMIVRVSATDESVMMPIIGRTLVHEEGVQLLRDWIDSLDPVCQ
jgi:uncharacterized repeat protein (TIGR03806 family)